MHYLRTSAAADRAGMTPARSPIRIGQHYDHGEWSRVPRLSRTAVELRHRREARTERRVRQGCLYLLVFALGYCLRWWAVP